MNNHAIAIIGISGIFPDAANLEKFYDNLRDKKDSVREPARERLIFSGEDPDKDYKTAGHLNRVDLFDHKFFQISKKEAEFMEPTQRMALELACEAIENAGYSLDDFKGSNTGIYMASSNLTPYLYLQRINEVITEKDPTIHTGTLNSMVFGRMAYALQLSGPAVMVDTGCSSSLIAMNEAVEKLAHGKIDCALVGAINVKLSFVEKGTGGGHLGVTSSDGKSRAFDADAAGIGIGEGGGMFLLKRLDDAVRDKDNIQAVIRGIGVSQDGGRSNSITAPSPVAQTAAIVNAWNNAGIDPETIAYVEAHGAGTQLGDVIEFQSLTDAFNTFTSKRHFCAVSSIKSNIGHLGNAAGIASVMKGVVSLKHKTILPTIHFDKPNPFIDFKNSGAYVNTTAIPWDNGAYPRRCGINSFGLSGTNAHLVLEEAPLAGAHTTASNDDDLFLKVSAKSVAALEAYLNRITEHLAQAGGSLNDILYTLNRGRADYAYRIGVHGKDKTALLQGLLDRLNTDVLKTLPAVKQKGKKVVLLFSLEQVDEALLSRLRKKYPKMEEAFADIQTLAGGPSGLTENIAVLAAQWATYKQFLTYGIPVRTIMGTGIGNITTKLITGTIGMAEAVDLAKHYSGAAAFDETKFTRAVKDLLAKEVSVFVEMGNDGVCYQKLQARKNEVKGLELTTAIDQHGDDTLMNMFTGLYNAGVSIDWVAHYNGAHHRRVEVPTYPFEKVRCWYEEPYKPIVEGVDQWFYALDWTPAVAQIDAVEICDQVFLVFCDEHGLNHELIKNVGTNNRCIAVSFADAFSQDATGNYTLNATSADDYERLRESLDEQGVQITGIFYLYNYTAPYALNPQNYNDRVERGFISLYRIIQTFQQSLQQPEFRFAAVTSNGHRVSKTESVMLPLHKMTSVFLKAMMTEFPVLKLTCVDVVYDEYPNDVLAASVMKEVLHEGLIRFVALRGTQRYVPKLAKVVFDATAIQRSFQFKDNGVFVVTGGATGLGLEASRMLAERGRCTVIILGRTPICPREMWATFRAESTDKSAIERIDALLELEQAGATVRYIQTDIGDFEQVQQAMKTIRAAYPAIDGVIHSSGLGSSGVSIALRNLQDVRSTLSPKVAGTIFLETATRELNPEFFVLFSSIGTIVPARNGSDYSAANAFEEAFAESMQLQQRNFVAINWSDWKETGLAYRKKLKKSEAEVASREAMIQGISNTEGRAAITCAIALNQPQVAVAKVDLSSFSINPFFVLDENAITRKTPAGITDCRAATAAATADANLNIDSTTDFERVRNISHEKVTETEARVISIWHKVLKLDSVLLDDDFYEVGGHSLNIMQLLNLVKKTLGVELGFEDILYHSTVRKLAAKIDTLVDTGAVTAFEPIMPLPAREYYNVSHAQKRFWLLNQLEGKEAYNVPAAYTFIGKVNPLALEQAFVAVIERHESLRTSFEMVNGEPMQKVHAASDVSFALPVIDLRNDTQRDTTAKAIVKKEAGKAFDLAKTPLLRILLIQLEDEKFIFVITMHHIVSDGRSIALLKNEALKFYKMFNGKKTEALPPLRIQYKEFVAWQNNQLFGDKLEQHKGYWTKRLDNSHYILALPTDFKSSDIHFSEADKVVFRVIGNELSGLTAIAEKKGTTLFMVTLAAFNVLLAKYTGTDDVVIGTPVSGREHSDLEDQIGIYLNTLLLRTHVHDDDVFLDFVSKVKTDTLRDFQHQTYPYDVLMLQILERHPNLSSLFNVGLTWSTRNELAESFDIDFQIHDYHTGFTKAKTDLWLLVSESPDELQMQFVYSKSLFKTETIEILADRFQVLIGQVAENPQKKMRELHIALPFEQQLEQHTLEVDFSF
ncbi:SDR family NAD(P)-dependent oxidoreductase [Chryseolinea lacunae]|uniref:SDR family NAD(P)-dependent oxidoreductase n=1 Tax=Chryseolinea lacunae TaxID=2801331 RepID=A0ABS1KUR0_9BACT|nr:SDR family NAD(P)-dependent oxidoreductase [Chryseolinea lacunae]MBL0743075.1 SDR family NAD(P)-dependent oxidoreductase [Chryseolinea lacunae]